LDERERGMYVYVGEGLSEVCEVDLLMPLLRSEPFELLCRSEWALLLVLILWACPRRGVLVPEPGVPGTSQTSRRRGVAAGVALAGVGGCTR
jgi:hypothetical protein